MELGILMITAILVLISILVVGRQIFLHFKNYSEPSLQLYSIRILLMIPVSFYSLN